MLTIDVGWLLFYVVTVLALGLFFSVAVVSYAYRSLRKKYVALAHSALELASMVQIAPILIASKPEDPTVAIKNGPKDISSLN